MFKNKLTFSFRRILAVLLLSVLSCVIVCLVILSPLALTKLDHLQGNWPQLSNIGQTYGAVSALLSSIALGGVVVSLLFQARSNRTEREETTRSLHHDLMKMEMNDPGLMTAMGAPWGLPIPANAAAIRGFLYVRMWTTFLAGSFALGEIAESDARYLAAHEIFGSQAGRDFRAAIGQAHVEHSTGRRHRFYEIRNEEYGKVVSENIAVAVPSKELAADAGGAEHAGAGRDEKFLRKDHVVRLGTIAAAAAMGAITERARRRYRH